MLLRKNTAHLLFGIIAASTINAGTMGPVAQEPFGGFYVEGNVGFADHPWKRDRTTTVGLENELGVLTNLSNINGGAIGGVDVGYQFAPFLALEAGWSSLPSARYSRDVTVTLPVAATTFTLPEGLLVHINSSLTYIAVKGTIPVYNQVEAFGKIGPAYTYNHTNVNVPASLVDSPTIHTTNHSNFWNPLFGFGLQYSALQNWRANIQYDYVPGYRAASASHFITPNTQLFTFGLGYKFSL